MSEQRLIVSFCQVIMSFCSFLVISSCVDGDSSAGLDSLSYDEIQDEVLLKRQSAISSYEFEVNEIKKVVEDEFKHQDIQGLAVAVVKDGEIVFMDGYGYADVENRVPVTERTYFRWASISKPLTAVAAMQLEESPIFDFSMDTDIRCYLPQRSWPQFLYDFVERDDYCVPDPEEKPMITMRHLLSNTSGIGHYGEIAEDYSKRSVGFPLVIG